MESGSDCCEPVARVGADEQHGADAQPHGGACRHLVELAGGKHRGRAQRKDHRRLAGGDKFFKMRGQRGVAGVGIVKAESGDERVRRPVFLLHAEHARKKRQHEIGRVLGVEDGIGAPRQAQFAAQRVDGLRPFAGDKAGQAAHGAAHAGHVLSARASRGYGGSTGGSKAEKNENGAST